MKMIFNVVIALLMVISTVAMAQTSTQAFDLNKPGVLFLFKKCDADLANTPGYDESGCPDTKEIWPVLFDGLYTRWGKLEYNLFGGDFKVAFEGHHLLPKTDYTLIYEPAPFPGFNLICLGSGESDRHGSLKIRQDNDIKTSLPADYDDNFANGIGAKIRLVLTEDVRCDAIGSLPPKLTAWHPGEYLFEYNPIVFEYLF